MATPFNPFAGRGQSAGEASTSGRGRGSVRGSMRGGTDRGNKWPVRARGRGGRGRGTDGTSTARGRGAGAAARGASLAASSTTTSTKSNIVSSPFAQLNSSDQPIQANPSNVFGKPHDQSQSPMPPPADMRGSAARYNTFSPGAAQHISRKSPAINGHGTSGGSTPFEVTSNSASYQDRYEQLKLDRAKQRQRAIKDGQMADPNQPTSLKKAITPVGTCTSMCPEFERVERIVQKMVDRSEKYLDPSTNTLQNMEAKMLKRFRRSAAGYDEQLPSDIRTPKTLLQATNYLIRHIVGGKEPLGIVHKFVWDRTRSIRNDFSVQQVTHEADVKIAVMCLERIARFHILSLHLLSSPTNEEQFDRHQEREQLNNTMLSLMYYYDDNRGRVHFPNEEEFRAYYIIFSIHDQRPDLEARVQKWPAALLNSPRVQIALELYAAACNTWEYQGTLDARRPNAIAQGFYSRFFQIIDSPSVSYLMACVAEIYFNHVRQTTIRAIWKAYCRAPASQQHKNEEWTVEQLTNVLYLDDDEQTIKFCEDQDLQFAENANGQMYLNWGNRPVDSVGFSPSSEHAFSESYVESKRAGRSLVAIVLGMSVREAAAMGMIDESAVPERREESPVETSAPIENTLFVSDKDNTTPAPIVDVVPTSLDCPEPMSATHTMSALNPFQQATPAIPHQATQSSVTIETTQPPNPFSSVFSNPQSGKVAEITPVNPFAAKPTPSPSPFAFPKPAGVAQDTTSPAPSFDFSKSLKAGPAVNEGAPFAPSAPSTFALPKPIEKAEQASAATVPSPFVFPQPAKVVQDTTSPAPSFDFSNSSMTAAAKEGAPSPFAFPKPVEKAEQVSAPTTTSPFSYSQSAAPAASPNPFAASLSAFVPPKPLLPTENATSSASAFGLTQQNSTATEPAKPSPFSGFSQSSFVPQSKPLGEEKTEHANQTPLSFSQSSQLPNTAPTPAPKLFGPSTGQSALSRFTTQKPLFPAPSSLASTGNAAESPSVEEKEQVSLQNQPASFSKPAPSNRGGGAVQTSPSTEPPATESALSVSQLEESTSSLSSTQTSVGSDSARSRPPQTEDDESALFKRIMKRAEERAQRKEEKRKRKRVVEEQAATDSVTEERLRASELSSREESPPPSKKFSLAESSVKALPTLPCLERTKALLDKKPTAEPDPAVLKKRQREIDEDEMLLNSARIVAEQLRTGPKIFDEMSPESLAQYNAYHAYWEERSKRRRSYSNSVTPSISTHAQSASPPQFPRHSYEVAYAPDTPLGLGRTMSRTEYRIRMTGGHGLAYKPLDFSRSKSLEKLKHQGAEGGKGKSRFAMSG